MDADALTVSEAPQVKRVARPELIQVNEVSRSSSPGVHAIQYKTRRHKAVSLCINGLCGARTHDIMVVTHALSQLS